METLGLTQLSPGEMAEDGETTKDEETEDAAAEA